MKPQRQRLFSSKLFILALSLSFVDGRSEVTFTRDVAPIVWSQCAPCHRPGQTAPFPLIDYSDVSRHGKQILKAIENDYMPPWPPSGFVKFQNDRRLSRAEKQTLRNWVAQGNVEGAPQDLPPAPKWKDGWLLGTPDLILTMPKPFTLSAEGGDLYRNFVIPVRIDRDRYVRAVEIAPGNTRIMHHAFLKMDPAATARSFEGAEAEPGFPGMNVTATMPGGQFLTWQPGKLPLPAPDNLAWLLPKNSDLVLQAHMNRSGKSETLQSSVGLYFTDVIPTNRAFKMALMSLSLRFPPGESNIVITDSFTLPVDVEALATLPHAHYLAREIKGHAVLPDGRKQWILVITNWDFRWQGDYRYVDPLKLPAGTTLHLEAVYDNSTNNLQNPNQPPKLVSYGPRSSDEMCELWLQLLPNSPADYEKLKAAYDAKTRKMFIERYQFVLKYEPNDPSALTSLSIAQMSDGKLSQAFANLQKAIRSDPNFEPAHYELGVLYRLTRRWRESKKELETALRLNPKRAKAWGHLGFVWAELGNAEQADQCFRKSLELDPTDEMVRSSLEELAPHVKKRP